MTKLRPGDKVRFSDPASNTSPLHSSIGTVISEEGLKDLAGHVAVRMDRVNRPVWLVYPYHLTKIRAKLNYND